MPFPLRKYADEFQRHGQKQLRASFRDIQIYISEVLEPEILGRIVKFADEVFHKNGRFNKKLFDRKKNRFLNITIVKPLNDYVKFLEPIFKRDMKDAFFTSRKMILKEMKRLHYPIDEIVTKEDPRIQFSKVDFEKGSFPDEIERKFLEKRLAESDLLPYLNVKLKFREEVHQSLSDGYTFLVEDEGEYFVWNVSDLPGGSYVKTQMLEVYEQTGKIKIPLKSPPLNKDFQVFLDKQFQAGIDPSTRIITFSQEHVNELRRRFLSDIRRGIDPTVTKNKFLNSVFSNVTDRKLRKRLEFNTMRILRTSYGNAAALSTSMFALRNQHLISGLMRVANGRPCPACALLDGSLWPVGSVLSDHPMGMCEFVPQMRTLQEMRFDLSKIPSRHLAATEKQMRGFPTWKEKMLTRMSDKDLRLMFGNNKLFNLWKTERFALENLVVKRNGMFLPITFKEISARLATGKVSSVSNPFAKIVNLKEGKTLGKNRSKEFIGRIDSEDNKGGLNIVFSNQFPDGVNPDLLIVKSIYGGNGFGLGIIEQNFIRNNLPGVHSIVSDILVRYGKDLNNLPFWVRNELNRRLGLFKRWTDNGSVYWVFTDKQLVEVKKLFP